MKNMQKITTVRDFYIRYVCQGDEREARYFVIQHRHSFFWGTFFELTPPYETLRSLRDSLPEHPHIISVDLSAIATAICGYQSVRQKRYFASGHPKDLTNVVLEELKDWCFRFQVDRDLSLSISKIEKRMQYIRAITQSELFPSRSWTKSDTCTMLGLLDNIERKLKKAKLKLEYEQKIGELKDRLSELKIIADNIVLNGIYYLAFAFRNTTVTTSYAGDVGALQSAEAVVKPIIETRSGALLYSLVRSPVLMRMFSSKPGSYQNEVIDTARETFVCLEENPFIVFGEERLEGQISQRKYQLREGILQRMQANRLSAKEDPIIAELLKSMGGHSLSGIDPAFWEPCYQAALESFLRMHGLVFELARVQAVVETAQRLVANAGQVAMMGLHQAVEVMTRCYKFVSDAMKEELEIMSDVAQNAASDTHHGNKKMKRVSSEWLDMNRRSTKDFQENMLSLMRASDEKLMRVIHLTQPEQHRQLVDQVSSLTQLFAIQTRVMKEKYGIALSDESERKFSATALSLQEYEEKREHAMHMIIAFLCHQVNAVAPDLRSMALLSPSGLKKAYRVLMQLKSRHVSVVLLRRMVAKCLQCDPHHTEEPDEYGEGALGEFFHAFYCSQTGQEPRLWEEKLFHRAHQEPLAGFLLGLLALFSQKAPPHYLAMGFFHDTAHYAYSLEQVKRQAGANCSDALLDAFYRLCELSKKMLMGHVIPFQRLSPLSVESREGRVSQKRVKPRHEGFLEAQFPSTRVSPRFTRIPSENVPLLNDTTLRYFHNKSKEGVVSAVQDTLKHRFLHGRC